MTESPRFRVSSFRVWDFDGSSDLRGSHAKHMRREEGAREEDRQTEMRPPLRLLFVLSAHSSSFKPSFAVSIAGKLVHLETF